MTMQMTLTAECLLPGCFNVVTVDGEPCRECVDAWGPYLHEKGTECVWIPATKPACGHGWWWWGRDGVCRHVEPGTLKRDCACSDLVPNNRVH